jgi:hypothetical protein
MKTPDTVSLFGVYDRDHELLALFKSQGQAKLFAKRSDKRDLEVVEDVYAYAVSYLKRRVDLGKVVF